VSTSTSTSDMAAGARCPAAALGAGRVRCRIDLRAARLGGNQPVRAAGGAPMPIWAVAPLALLVSLGASLSEHGISAGNRLSLVLIHVAVAGIAIHLYHRTAIERTLSRRVGRS
jgi:hypothetical protein